MSGVELPLENISYEGVAISEIGVTDEVKRYVKTTYTNDDFNSCFAELDAEQQYVA